MFTVPRYYTFGAQGPSVDFYLQKDPFFDLSLKDPLFGDGVQGRSSEVCLFLFSSFVLRFVFS